MPDEPRPNIRSPLALYDEIRRQMENRVMEDLHSIATSCAIVDESIPLPEPIHADSMRHTLDAASYAINARANIRSAYGVSSSALPGFRRAMEQERNLQLLLKGITYVNDTQVPEKRDDPNPHPDLLEHAEDLCKAYAIPLGDHVAVRKIVSELATNMLLDAAKCAQINVRLHNHGPTALASVIKDEEISLAETLRYLLEQTLAMAYIYDFTHVFDLTPAALARHADERNTTPWTGVENSED